MAFRFWRPAPLLVETHPQLLREGVLNLPRVADSMKKGGLFIIASVIQGEFTARTVEARQQELHVWNELIARERFKALPVCTVAKSFRDGVRQCLQLTGLGPVRPNLIMLSWFGSHMECGLGEFAGIVRDIRLSDMHLAVCRNFDTLNTAEITFYTSWMRLNPVARGVVDTPVNMFLDVWALPLLLPSHSTEGLADTAARSSVLVDKHGLPGATEDARPQADGWPEFSTSLELCLLLANTLRMSPFWGKHTAMRLVAISDTNEGMAPLHARWTRYLSHVRMRAAIKVISMEEELLAAGLPPTPPSKVSLGRDKMPISSLAAPAFFGRYPPAARLATAQRLLLLHSRSTCIAFLPASPQPGSEAPDQDLAYLADLQALTDRAPACMLLHARTPVIYTDL